VVRDPFTRLESCYRSKILNVDKVAPGMRRCGLWPAMPFAEFVERVAKTPDRRADIHFRSQSDIVLHRQRPLAHVVARFETLAEDWEQIRRGAAAAGKLRLPAWPTRRRPPPSFAAEWSPHMIGLAQERYAEDFERFYPNATDPTGRTRLTPRQIATSATSP